MGNIKNPGPHLAQSFQVEGSNLEMRPKRLMEAAIGFEPMHGGFADLRAERAAANSRTKVQSLRAFHAHPFCSLLLGTADCSIIV